jgi:hypothetical protein
MAGFVIGRKRREWAEDDVIHARLDEVVKQADRLAKLSA